MTADAMEGDKEKCIEAGMDDYVSKPINLATLQASIERWGRTSQKRSAAGSTEYVPVGEVEESIVRRMNELGGETDPAFIEDLLGTYLLDAKKRLERMSDSIKKKDAKEIYFEAHSLKGASMTFGANTFAALLHSIEEAAMEGRFEGLDSALDKVKVEFGRMESSLRMFAKKGSQKS